ncbi:MAG: outer membrane beta-barrel protein [Sphingobacteriales bacterium]
MKKNFTILSAVLITLFSLNAKAQDEVTQAKSYLGITGGFSTPAGNFSQSNYSNNSAGFAKKGTTLGLDAGIYLYKNFGIGITFSYQDQGELTGADAQNLANGYLASFGKDEANVTAVNRYQNLNLMAGPQYSFLYKKFTLDLRASAGIIKSSSTPFIGVVFNNSPNSATYLNQLKSGGSAFAYGGSVGLRYSVSDSWDIGLKYNYINSDGIKIENSGPAYTGVGRYQTKLPITEIQTTLGISLKF